MVYTYSVILNDAFYYLNQSKGLPDIPSSEPLRQRNLRACVLFSWIAVEEMVHYSAGDLLRQKSLKAMPRGRLSDMLTEVLLRRGAVPIKIEEFRAMRRVRNLLTHPATTSVPEVFLSLKHACGVFDYCASLVEQIAPHKLMLERPRNRPLLPARGTREIPPSADDVWLTDLATSRM